MQAEADRNGTTPGDEMKTMLQFMDNAKAEAEAWLRDPDNLKDTINREVRHLRRIVWEGFRHDRNLSHEEFEYLYRDSWEVQMAFLPYVEKIVEVITVKDDSSLGGTREYAEAVAKRNGGITDVVTFKSWSLSGSYYEQPDGETFVEWHALPHTWEDPGIDLCECIPCAWVKAISSLV